MTHDDKNDWQKSPTAWFAVFDRAVEQGDAARAKRCKLS